MFSSIFGKRRSSPVEDETPPIPGPKPDDSFIMVDPSSPSTGLYPNVSGPSAGIAAPKRPAPPTPTVRPNVMDQTFHYLQGVPFSMSRDLQMATNKDAIVTEVGELLLFLTSKLNMTSYEYGFEVEKSVLKEI